MAEGSPSPAGGCECRQEGIWVGVPGAPLHLPHSLARTELSDHLDAMDSNLDNLQTMLTNHGFSVDTSALLDVSPVPACTCTLPALGRSLTTLPSPQLFSPSVTVPDMSLPDLDSSLASVRRWHGGIGEPGTSRIPHCNPPAPADPGAPLSPGTPQAS